MAHCGGTSWRVPIRSVHAYVAAAWCVGPRQRVVRGRIVCIDGDVQARVECPRTGGADLESNDCSPPCTSAALQGGCACRLRFCDVRNRNEPRGLPVPATARPNKADRVSLQHPCRAHPDNGNTSSDSASSSACPDRAAAAAATRLRPLRFAVEHRCCATGRRFCVGKLRFQVWNDTVAICQSPLRRAQAAVVWAQRKLWPSAEWRSAGWRNVFADLQSGLRHLRADVVPFRRAAGWPL